MKQEEKNAGVAEYIIKVTYLLKSLFPIKKVISLENSENYFIVLSFTASTTILLRLPLYTTDHCPIHTQ